VNSLYLSLNVFFLVVRICWYIKTNIHDLMLCFNFLIVCFIRGHNLDPDDSEVLFHLALNQALMRQVCYNVLKKIYIYLF